MVTVSQPDFKLQKIRQVDGAGALFKGLGDVVNVFKEKEKNARRDESINQALGLNSPNAENAQHGEGQNGNALQERNRANEEMGLLNLYEINPQMAGAVGKILERRDARELKAEKEHATEILRQVVSVESQPTHEKKREVLSELQIKAASEGRIEDVKELTGLLNLREDDLKAALATKKLVVFSIAELLKVGAERENPFSKIDPSKYTPESLAIFQKSGKVADLRQVSGGEDSPFSKINPKDFTSESLRVFQKTRNHADLKRRPSGASSQITGALLPLVLGGIDFANPRELIKGLQIVQSASTALSNPDQAQLAKVLEVIQQNQGAIQPEGQEGPGLISQGIDFAGEKATQFKNFLVEEFKDGIPSPQVIQDFINNPWADDATKENQGFVTADYQEVFEQIPGVTVDENGFFFEPNKNAAGGKRFVTDENGKRVRSSQFVK